MGSLLLCSRNKTAHAWPKHPTVTTDSDEDEDISCKQDAQDSPLSDLKSWGWDILSCFLACVAMMAIVVTLARHDNHILPDWRFGISVNALVAVFATIWKASMLAPVANAISQAKWSWFRKPRPLIDLLTFDDASRGTIGSIWLIGRLKALHLASLGAMISILALASDPFIQQVVKYESCKQPVENGTATLPRANVYLDPGYQYAGEAVTLSYGMQAALFNGVYNSFAPAKAHCLTGNCTFPDYRTIAMCGACENLSSQLVRTCKPYPPPIRHKCTWKLPSSFNLTLPSRHDTAMVMASDISNVESPEQGALSGNPTQGGPIGPLYNLASTTEIISLTSLLNYDRDPSFYWGTTGQQSIMALQCSLRPCVRTYSVSTVQNNLVDTLLSVHNMTYNETTTLPEFVATPMPCLINGSYFEADAFSKRNATNTNEITGLLPNNASAWLPNECIYAYTNPLGLFEDLPAFFAGHVSAGLYGSKASPDWLGQLFNNDSTSLAWVNQTWSNIADSMTAHMRQNGRSGFSSPVTGQVWTVETCISVQWAWLSFPLALLLLTIVLLLCTIIDSVRHQRGRIWKASPIALLFHGLQGEVADAARVLHSTTEMNKTAKSVHASITEDGPMVGLVGYLSEEG